MERPQTTRNPLLTQQVSSRTIFDPRSLCLYVSCGPAARILHMTGHDHDPHHGATLRPVNQTLPRRGPTQQPPRAKVPKSPKSLHSAAMIPSPYLPPLPQHLGLTHWEIPPLIVCFPYDPSFLLIQTLHQQVALVEVTPMAFQEWFRRQDRVKHPLPAADRELQCQTLRLLKRPLDPKPAQTLRLHWSLALKSRRTDRGLLEDVR
jgi:hypothetical protein